MATLEQRLSDFASAVGTDVKSLNAILGGGTAAMSTAVGGTGDKSVVQALSALKSLIDGVAASTAIIDDTAITTTTNKTYSISKITELVAAIKADILGGVPATTLDTIKELADYLSDSSVAGGIVQKLGKKVDVSVAQAFTSDEQIQARNNINAASATDLSNLTTAVGNTDQNLVTVYTAAKTAV